MAMDYSRARSLEQARYQALAKGWPALYVALSADIIAVAVVHAPYVPWWASTILPAILVPKALIWAYLWHRKRNEIPSSAECARSMRFLGIEVTAWMAVIVAWQTALSCWGTPQSQLLLALCMGGQMVFLLFGLLHLPVASTISATLCAAGLFFIGTGVGQAVIGIVILLVGGVAGLAHVAHDTYRDFTSLVLSRLSLQRKTDEIEELSETNLRLANTDMLTELGNRRRFFHDLKAVLDRARASGGRAGLGIIDLDGFKAINDSNGHLVGDRLLRAMAERLQLILAEQGGVYRLGGDEFAFIVTGACDDKNLLAIGEKLIEAVHAPIYIGELRLVVGCSVGFASFPDKADTETDLYDRADYALFAAKRTGRLKATVFNEEHERAVREAALIERTMRAADLEAEFYLTFQPIVDSSSGRTLLLECLARWQSPTLGAVPPGKFIVAAEQSGFITTLTPLLLRKALLAVANWPEDVGISFNLSGHDITAPEKVMNLIAIVKRSGIAPKRIEFEVTETALMMNIELALANINLLKAAGVRIALDDFGTGYSSLSQIQKLPLDKIKVDGSFVRDLATSEASQKIVRSVSALSRDLALSCVVEGVETREQLDILQNIGCHLIQGYYFSKPMPETQVEGFLAESATSERARAGVVAS